MQELKGKTIYELEPEEFEKLFCQRCNDYENCSRKPVRMVHCRILLEIGHWGESKKAKTLMSGDKAAQANEVTKPFCEQLRESGAEE